MVDESGVGGMNSWIACYTISVEHSFFCCWLDFPRSCPVPLTSNMIVVSMDPARSGQGIVRDGHRAGWHATFASTSVDTISHLSQTAVLWG
jgi:hypothetical protein